MKKLLLPIYIILAVMVSLYFFESAMKAANDQIPLFAYAFFSGVIAFVLTKRLMRKLRIF